MNFDITFLGTGSAIPTKRKNHSGILIKTQNENILLDCGEGIQRQFRFADENFARLTKILITHWHEDHTLGLAGLLKTMGMMGYANTLEIYGPPGTLEKLSALQQIYSRFKIQIKAKEVTEKVFENSDILIEASKMDHGIYTNAYAITIKDKIRIDKQKLKKLKIPNSPLIGQLAQGKDIVFNGKKIKAKSLIYVQKGKKLTIILDTAMNDSTINLAKNSDALICESTFSADETEHAKEHKHLTSAQAANIAKKAKAKSLYIVHLSQKHEHNEKQILAEAKKIFKNTFTPKELEKVTI